MERYSWLSQVIFAIWIAGVCGGSASADDAGVPFFRDIADPVSLGYMMLIRFCVTVAAEYLVVLGCLTGRLKAFSALFVWVLLINVVTNPAAQFGVAFVADPAVLGSEAAALLMWFGIELAVVAVEFGLLRWIFTRMYQRHILNEPVSMRRTIVIVLLANLASILAGTLGFGMIMRLVTI